MFRVHADMQQVAAILTAKGEMTEATRPARVAHHTISRLEVRRDKLLATSLSRSALAIKHDEALTCAKVSVFRGWHHRPLDERTVDEEHAGSWRQIFFDLGFSPFHRVLHCGRVC